MKIQIALALAFLALAPVAATAATQEEQDACMNDAFTICGHAIPDRGRVAACLGQNISRISVACRTVMQRYQAPETSAAVSKPALAKPATTAAISKRPLRTKTPRSARAPLDIKPKLSGSAAPKRTASRS